MTEVAVSSSPYRAPHLFIAGIWRAGRLGQSHLIHNPATGQAIGELSLCSDADIDEAIAASCSGFSRWKKVAAFKRSETLIATANLLRAEVQHISTLLTLEQGKPLAEARAETLAAAAIIQWYGEEATRTYGRIVPARLPNCEMLVYKEPVGPCAAFSPWNFPLVLSSRKLAGALAAGCSVVLKAAEEAPAAVAAMVDCFVRSGVTPEAIQLLFGIPSQVSSRLLASPLIRKVSFTGSIAVGKHLARLATENLQRVTLELGGHAPVIICDDARIDDAVNLLISGKFRNAGQACLAPTRIFVQTGLYDEFVERFSAAASDIRLGDGMLPTTQMGPLANVRRQAAMGPLIDDAVDRGASVSTGGMIPDGSPGFFFKPTVLVDVPDDAAVMNIEPFGPIAACAQFTELEEAIARANGNCYGLSAFVFTGSYARQQRAIAELNVGVIAVNSLAVSNPETPFGGVKDSGYGAESGIEGLEAYMHTKFAHIQADGRM